MREASYNEGVRPGEADACRRIEACDTGVVEYLQQVQLVCPGNSFGAVTDPQLAVGIRDVTLDGGEADEEMTCNLLVPRSYRNET